MTETQKGSFVLHHVNGNDYFYRHHYVDGKTKADREDPPKDQIIDIINSLKISDERKQKLIAKHITPPSIMSPETKLKLATNAKQIIALIEEKNTLTKDNKAYLIALDAMKEQVENLSSKEVPETGSIVDPEKMKDLTARLKERIPVLIRGKRPKEATLMTDVVSFFKEL